MLDALAPQIREGTPLVGIEPSCVAAFRDELPGLMPHDEDAKRLSLQSLTLAELLCTARARLAAAAPRGARPGPRPLPPEGGDRDGRRERALRQMGLDFEVLDSGCCGLAGSFGFEREHDEISRQIGEQRLMPIVREASEETILIADGFSCKTQIEQMTERRALHTAQVIELAMQREGAGPDRARPPPEEGFPDVVLDGEGRLREAAVLGGALLAAGVGAAALLGSRGR